MTKVVADITMSLDGFVTGPHPDLENGLGIDGLPLHNWAIASDDPVDAQYLREATAASGAVVMGRRLFDTVDGPQGWNEERGYGASEVGTPPFYVVTHNAPKRVRLALDFTFVTEGIASAVEQARARAAESGNDAVIMGGGDVIRQAVDAGLVDELRIHLSPILLGAGTPLFVDATRREFTQREVRVSRFATHLFYDLRS